jgi:hypothetical protein
VLLGSWRRILPSGCGALVEEVPTHLQEGGTENGGKNVRVLFAKQQKEWTRKRERERDHYSNMKPDQV